MKTKELKQSPIGANGRNNSNYGMNNTDKNESPNNNELITYEQIEGTPFTIISKNNKHFLAVGNHRVSEETNIKEELIKMVDVRDYSLLTQLIGIIGEHIVAKQLENQTGNK